MTNNSKIKLVVFDMAGTTIYDENNVAKAFQSAMNRHGYPSVSLQEANEKMGYSKPQAIRELLEIHELNVSKITNQLIDQIHIDFVSSMLHYYQTDPSVRAVSDAEMVFEALHEMGIKVALDTGFSRDITDIILKRVGWDSRGLIDATAASDEVPKGRPFPFMIQKIMSQLGIEDPKEVIKIGDTEVDIHEGHNAGCLMTIGVTSGVYSADQLNLHFPSFLVDSLSELLQRIKEYQTSAE